METQEKNPIRQPSDLLTAVFNIYEKQNAAVVSLIHREVLASISGIKMGFQLATRNPKEFKKLLDRYIDAANKTFEDLQIIHNELYPKILKHIGLTKSFTSYTNECASNYSVDITLRNKTNFCREPHVVLKHLFDKINIIRLYKAALLNLICEQGAVVLTTTLSNTERSLTIQIQVNAKKTTSDPVESIEAFFIESKDTIDARIISLQGKVEAKTDWVNYVGFSIPVNFPLEEQS